jgi:gluconate 2-dehydrogenase gamma chain
MDEKSGERRGGVTRRGLLWAGGLAALPLAPAGAFTYQAGGMPWEPGRSDHPRAVDPRPGYLFFEPAEAAFIEAAAERMVPKDENGPGAAEIGIPFFIDRQLAGAYGQGGTFYMQGPWAKGEKTQGYQSKLPPAGYYRAALKSIAKIIADRHQGTAFAQLPPDQQDQFLKDLEGGHVELEDVDGKYFFTLLLQNVREGLFADPLYGGNRNMAGWKLIGFPGAHYNYRDMVGKHGQRVDLDPVGLFGRDTNKKG